MPKSYKWDAERGRYLYSSGRVVPKKRVAEAMYEAAGNAGKRMQKLSRSLQSGSITRAQWLAEMRGEVKSVHLYSGAASRGGWDAMRSTDFGRVGQRVRTHYAHLDRFAAELKEGLPLDGRFLARTDMYGSAGRQTFMLVDQAENRERGMTEERSLLSGLASCDECVSEAGTDWAPIGSLQPVGSRTCMSNCTCFFEYRRGGAR